MFLGRAASWWDIKPLFASTVQRAHGSCPDSVEHIMLLPEAGVGSGGKLLGSGTWVALISTQLVALLEWQVVTVRSGIQA